MRIVIAGGGIMGVSTAFYIDKLLVASNKRDAVEIIIVDQAGIAKAASGKAGGFLARSWAAGALKPLAELGFDMFPELAEEFGGVEKIKYRRINSVSGKVVREKHGVISETSILNRPKIPKPESKRDIFNNVFDKEKMTAGQHLGNTETTAQVNSWSLVNLMFEASGAQLVVGEIVGVKFHQKNPNKIVALTLRKEEEIGDFKDSDDVEAPKVKDKRITFEDIEGDEFCFCLGVWTDTLRQMKVRVPHSMGRKIHAVIIKPREDIKQALSYLNMAIFTDFNNTEIIIREGGICYINGSEKNYETVTLKPHEIIPDEKACKKILGFWEYLTTKSKGSAHHVFKDVTDNNEEESQENNAGTQVITSVACHLPMVKHEYEGEQLPVMSVVPKTLNAYVCAGHTCWGILLGPLCGKIMAELIINNDPHKIVDTTPFQLKSQTNNPANASKGLRVSRKEKLGKSKSSSAI